MTQNVFVGLSVWVCRDGNQLQIAQNEFASPKHRSFQSFYGPVFGDKSVYTMTHIWIWYSKWEIESETFLAADP